MKKLSNDTEYIKSGDKIVAIIVRSSKEIDNLEFFTQESDSLQVGMHNKNKNIEINPHFHVGSRKVIEEIHEVLFIIEGKIEVSFYSGEGEYISKSILKSGDLLIHQSGGHGFRILEKSKILEIKQGPYEGIKQSKIYIHA